MLDLILDSTSGCKMSLLGVAIYSAPELLSLSLLLLLLLLLIASHLPLSFSLLIFSLSSQNQWYVGGGS